VRSRLVIMGSGETAPTSLKLHRELISGATHPAMLDTPYGFQANADDLNVKIGEYFAESVGTPLTVARWRRADEPVLDRERALSLLARSTYAFAGPGSPSYALRQWHGTPIPPALLGIVERGGTIVMGSAAAVTMGAQAIPVYEIYKVGIEPHWLEGLDLVGALTGIAAAVIPHYDNREGGRHDTRFCYLGEQRLHEMEGGLPEGTGILGVDEHTAVIFDPGDGTVAVHGAGGATVRVGGDDYVIPSGQQRSLDDVRALFAGSVGASGPIVAAPEPADEPIGTETPPSLAAVSHAARADFDERLAAGDADGAAAACLEVEEAIHAWSTDTVQGDDVDTARRILRSMIVDLAASAHAGLRDPRDTLAPIVDVALTARADARTRKDFALSDRIRDDLAAAGIEVKDTPDGQFWELR
jgi:hypothetical protein